MALASHDPITVTIDADVAGQIRAVASRLPQDSKETFWRQLASAPDVPERLLLELLDAGLYLDELAHRSGPPALLERIAHEHGYPEAILTLLKQAYVDAGVPLERFEDLVRRFGIKCPWALESLARCSPSAVAKRQAYLAQMDAQQANARQAAEATAAEARAEQTTDAEEIQKLFELREPRVLRALAKNRATPEALLRELADLRELPISRVVRSLALANLRERRRGDN